MIQVSPQTRILVAVEPVEIRRAYREQMASHLESIEREAARRQIVYQRASTGESYLRAIEAYLGIEGLGRGKVVQQR